MSEKDDIGSIMYSVRWVLSKKVNGGESITKARLCA